MGGIDGDDFFYCFRRQLVHRGSQKSVNRFPDRWKRWYRINFAMLPLWLMGLIVVVAVFVLYQFVTADLQPFIYFQF
ncbi:MAG: hypothetical protein K5882_11475 [Bacteroidales bacterium]|nr:hypothetical protein [Bacteroidales bacterium]